MTTLNTLLGGITREIETSSGDKNSVIKFKEKNKNKYELFKGQSSSEKKDLSSDESEN